MNSDMRAMATMIREAKESRDSDGVVIETLDAQFQRRVVDNDWTGLVAGFRPDSLTIAERRETGEVGQSDNSGDTMRGQTRGARASEKVCANIRKSIASKEGAQTAVTLILDQYKAADLELLPMGAGVELMKSLWALPSKGMPKAESAPVSNETAKVSSAKVANGYYAIRTSDDDENAIAFYRVTQGKAGSRWEGFTFLAVMASDDAFPVRDREKRAAILAEIASNEHEAGKLYGQKIGRCSRCRKALTDQTSRDYGMGPECRRK